MLVGAHGRAPLLQFVSPRSEGATRFFLLCVSVSWCLCGEVRMTLSWAHTVMGNFLGFRCGVIGPHGLDEKDIDDRDQCYHDHGDPGHPGRPGSGWLAPPGSSENQPCARGSPERRRHELVEPGVRKTSVLGVERVAGSVYFCFVQKLAIWVRTVHFSIIEPIYRS